MQGYAAYGGLSDRMPTNTVKTEAVCKKQMQPKLSCGRAEFYERNRFLDISGEESCEVNYSLKYSMLRFSS
jgi:hypothetical protein